jgi:hypothetical protein
MMKSLTIIGTSKSLNFTVVAAMPARASRLAELACEGEVSLEEMA